VYILVFVVENSAASHCISEILQFVLLNFSMLNGQLHQILTVSLCKFLIRHMNDRMTNIRKMIIKFQFCQAGKCTGIGVTGL
jgi:hypothetical protein